MYHDGGIYIYQISVRGTAELWQCQKSKILWNILIVSFSKVWTKYSTIFGLN